MASSVIGALRVNLGLDSAQFTRGAANAQTTMQKMSGKMVIAGAAIAAAVGGAAFEFVKMTRQAINTADEISKAAQKIGIGTEELSRLRFAADLSGVSFEQLQVGIGRLNRNMVDTARGTGAARQAFAQLGIDVKNADGTLRTSTEIMGDVADKFATMEDGALKSALAMELFGKSGATLIPMLNGGRAELIKMTEEASRFGVVIDAETGKKAEAFNDNLTRLSGVFSATATKVAAEMLPAMVAFTDHLVANSDQIQKNVQGVMDFFRGLGVLSDKVASATSFMDNRFFEVGQTIITFMVNPLERVFRLLQLIGKAKPELKFEVDERQEALKDILGPALSLENIFKPLRTGGGELKLTGGKGSVKSGLNEVEQAAKQAASQFAALQDRLNPVAASARKFAEEMSLIQNARVDDAKKEVLITQLEAEAFRNRTSALGDARVSRGLLNQGALPTIDNGDINRTTGQISAQLEADRIIKETGNMKEALKVLAKASQDTTKTVAESFGQMADRTIQAFDRMISSIQGGGFFGILNGLLNFGIQLGGIGVFGKDIQGRINSAPSFAGGGFTGMGARAGGLDGKGGFMAMLHPRETVIDHTRGQGGGVHVTVGVDPRTGNLLAFTDSRIAATAPAIASAGANIAQAQMANSARRRIR